MTQTTLGARLAKYRKLERLSAQKLADQSGLTRSVITNIENGRRRDITVSELLALSAALGVPPTALMFDITRPLDPVDGPDIVVSMSVSNGKESTVYRKPTLAEALKWYAIESSAKNLGLGTAGPMITRQVDAWRYYISSSNQLVDHLRKYKSRDAFENEKDNRVRIESGQLLLQAWRAYREAINMEIEGLPSPTVPEKLSDQLLAGALASTILLSAGDIVDYEDGDVGTVLRVEGSEPQHGNG